MTFDNSIKGSPSTLTLVKQHLPIVAVVVGIAFAFIGLHSAATGLVALAALHIVGAVLYYAIGSYRLRSRSASPTGHRS